MIALGGKPDEVGYDMLTNGTQLIINAMKKYNVKRIAVVTSIGTGDSVNQAPLFFKLIMWTAMKSIMKDKNNQEDLDHFIALVKKMQEPVRPPPRKPLNFKRFADHKNCECYIDSEGYFFDCVLCKYACCKECHKTEYGYKCIHHEDPLNSIGTEGT